MSMKRRIYIQETQRLQQKFFEDYSRFENWLKSAEMFAARPNSSEVLYKHAKEELKKFEAFQRHIDRRLPQLELINKQYRHLVLENRTDSARKCKQRVHDGNWRWDNLQKRVAAILRRLRHFTNRRDEFEATRESILVWLTEMDLQLTNVEHFSKSNFDDKMRQLKGFQQEITLNTNKIDQLIVFGEQLIQKSEPLDATLIEDELEELHRYCQEVFGRVARFHRRLTSKHPGLDDEKETSENETDLEDSREIQNDPWHKKGISEVPSSPQSLCQLMPPSQGHERSGCETPVSVDSIPLEWDHTGDVGGSSSHEDEEEEATYYSALSGIIDRWELIQAQDLRNKLRMKQELQQWQQLNSDLSDVSAWLARTEEELEELQKLKPPTSMQVLEQRAKKLKQLEKELLEQQPKVNSLQELTSYLLLKSFGDYIEADEKVYVIGKKLKQLLEQVSHDLKTIQAKLGSSAFLLVPDDLDSGVYNTVAEESSPAIEKITARRTSDGRKSSSSSSTRGESHLQTVQRIPRSPSFFSRVLRAALPLQMFFLLILFLAFTIPSCEDDYSCSGENKFTHAFYPMLHYPNGPPPT
ncbi:nesprin-2-like [Calypte anna]|uniref:nesprin-2-like n=1 Tax=Calypte anna TaxID=9244 RepID=UPI0011C44048|nr:nesprin-2-like [Calypte anna]